MPARTARTSSTARVAALAEANGTPETSCAPNAQQRTQTAPSAAMARSDHAAVAGCDPGQAKHRQGREDEDGDDEHGRAGHDEVGVPRSDRVAQRLDADPGVPPVGNGIERAVESRVEPMSRTFTITSRPRSGPTTQARTRRSPAGRARARARTAMPSSGSLSERAERERAGWSRSDQGDPDEQQARRWSGPARSSATRMSTRRGAARCAHVGEPRATTCRGRTTRRAAQARREACLGQRRGAATSAAATVRDDALSRGDDLAPVAGRQRRPHPRQPPTGCEERVARHADQRGPRRRSSGRRRC